MLRMPKDMEDMFDEWADSQSDPKNPTEMPQELKDYLEERHRIIREAEKNGCMIG